MGSNTGGIFGGIMPQNVYQNMINQGMSNSQNLLSNNAAQNSWVGYPPNNQGLSNGNWNTQTAQQQNWYPIPKTQYEESIKYIDLVDFSHDFIYWVKLPELTNYEEVIIYLAGSGFEYRHFGRYFDSTSTSYQLANWNNVGGSIYKSDYMLYIAFENEDASTAFLLRYDGALEIEKIEKE